MTAQPAAAPTRRRRSYAWAVLALVVLAAITVAVAAVQVFDAANARYDEAVARHASASAAASEAVADLEGAAADAAEPLPIGQAIVAAAADGYADAALKESLAASVTELTSAVEDRASDVDRAPAERVGPRPTWFADLDREAERLDRDSRRLESAAESAAARASELQEASERVVAEGSALVESVAASAPSVDAATVSASNGDRLALRAAIGEVTAIAAQAPWSLAAAAEIQEYVVAASAAQASHAAEEAENAGPLAEQRAAAEAFAHSLAGGVLIEIDWAPIVNGFGSGGSYGGWATWEPGGGVATIQLSDSVAELWPSDGVQSLIAHEVGHAMIAKCPWGVPEPATREANEAWATAWAIGMGFHADGNGESLYGRPSDALIEQTLACR
ncbi:hypothetical protein [Agromyces sp. Marseille-P2726]|uniref:hypothetical protein n=1 Tax=Agromyces sp. Marseille-P2726 TaxID=2709132 RepID=UPI00156EF066|nr:hypothetical protein [Agromyces sp. Marseille-P2726]